MNIILKNISIEDITSAIEAILKINLNNIHGEERIEELDVLTTLYYIKDQITKNNTEYYAVKLNSWNSVKRLNKYLPISIDNIDILTPEDEHTIVLCSHCHSIKTEKGYIPLASFFDQFYENVSHGMCKPCMTTLYPDYCNKNKGD